jgi:hypothetical protein
MSNKQQNQVKQQIFHHLVEIVELFPQYTTVQHLVHIMRPQTGCYSWSEEQLLKKFEKYRDELENELADKVEAEEDYK